MQVVERRRDMADLVTPAVTDVEGQLAAGKVARALGDLARVSKDLEASAVFPQAQLFSIFSSAYYPRQRCGAYRARSKVV